MKRSTIVTGVTVVGVAWLLNYKVTAHQLTAIAPVSPTQNRRQFPESIDFAVGHALAITFTVRVGCSEWNFHWC